MKTKGSNMRLTKYSLLSFLLLFSYTTSASGQAGRAELIGEVRDQNGASVPAKVTLTEVATDQTLTQATEDGAYLLTNLKPGIYTVTVEANGFKRSVHENIRLATGERIRLDLLLEPGTVSELVTVTQDASLLRPESGSLGQVINNRKLVDV